MSLEDNLNKFWLVLNHKQDISIPSETKKLIKFYIDKAQQNLSFILEKKRKNLILYSELILNREF